MYNNRQDMRTNQNVFVSLNNDKGLAQETQDMTFLNLRQTTSSDGWRFDKRNGGVQTVNDVSHRLRGKPLPERTELTSTDWNTDV